MLLGQVMMQIKQNRATKNMLTLVLLPWCVFSVLYLNHDRRLFLAVGSHVWSNVWSICCFIYINSTQKWHSCRSPNTPETSLYPKDQLSLNHIQIIIMWFLIGICENLMLWQPLNTNLNMEALCINFPSCSWSWLQITAAVCAVTINKRSPCCLVVTWI